MLRLRGLYGLYLSSKPFSKNLCSKGSTFVDSPEAALDVQAEARPEEVSYYIYGMPMPSVEIVDCCRMFADYVSEFRGRVPQWATVAFWWLSYAVDGSISADDIAAAIERWYPLVR